jgi:Icc-related predicted phosphoesterase
MKFNFLICTLSAAVMALGSGSSWSQDQTPDQKPIDCSTARDDINALVHEHKSTDERMVKGVFSIMPIGLVLNETQSATTSKSAKENKEMDIKEYNLKIDQRITDIKRTCNIQ